MCFEQRIDFFLYCTRTVYFKFTISEIKLDTVSHRLSCRVRSVSCRCTSALSSVRSVLILFLSFWIDDAIMIDYVCEHLIVSGDRLCLII